MPKSVVFVGVRLSQDGKVTAPKRRVTAVQNVQARIYPHAGFGVDSSHDNRSRRDMTSELGSWHSV